MLLPRVLILAGGLSHERDVSLRSARRVSGALRDAGCDVRVADLDSSLLSTLASGSVDVVWPLLHGASGEDGAVRDVLEMSGVPYVGSDAGACRRAWDKAVAAAEMRDAGVSVPALVALPHDVFEQLGADGLLDVIGRQLGLPLVIKPSRGGSALGCRAVASMDSVPSALVECFAYGDVALIERRVEGVEVAVSVVDTGDGPSALPPVEIVPDADIYDYEARYTAGATEFFCPARLTPAAMDAVRSCGLTAHRTFGLRHLSRTDLIVDSDGVPWFLEVNVAPGMTETSLLPQSLDAAGLALPQLYRDLAVAALDGAAGTVERH